MFKLSKNPWVIDKTKKTYDRECALADIPYVIREDGSKGCIWCGDPLKTNHHLQRYCKDKLCPKSAYIWGYPQRSESLIYLLKKQNMKCNDCSHDYNQYFIEEDHQFEINSDNYNKIRKLIPQEFKPEVDHIVAIMQGGESLGINNHQVLCYACHKKKTKKDIKKPRRKKTKAELIKLKHKRVLNKIYEKMGQFQEKYYTKDWEDYNKNYNQKFFNEVLNKEELLHWRYQQNFELNRYSIDEDTRKLLLARLEIMENILVNKYNLKDFNLSL